MVLHASAQPEDRMLLATRDFVLSSLELVEEDAFGPGASVWACDTTIAKSRALWVGHRNPDGTTELFAYLALIAANLGGLPVMEAKKAWTDPEWRRRGLGRGLLLRAAQIAPVLSDSDGMTDEAFAQWNSSLGLRKRWWDEKTRNFVAEATVPQEDRHTGYAQGSRWRILLG